MGWSSGGELAESVWKKVKKYIPEPEQQKVAREIVDLFQDHDADDWSDTEVYDVAWPEKRPGDYDREIGYDSKVDGE